MPNPTPKEDTWASQPIGSPFPDNPVKVLGQQNMYVALWYKNGKPIHGYAWNDGGVVQASFPYNAVELTGKDNLGGLIQVLQYQGDHNALGYWYEWIQYKERFEKADTRQLVRCGQSIPILWTSRNGDALLGYLDMKSEEAFFSQAGKAEKITGKPLAEMKIIVRNMHGGPPGCVCSNCPKGPPPKLIMLNEWADIRMGDPWPGYKLIKAGGKTLNTAPGESPDQYVALWYVHGEPVMGRVWKSSDGKVAAAFGWNGKAFTSNIGSIQVLVDLPEQVRGFDYHWRPFTEAATHDKSNKEYHPVHVNNVKGNISPCLLTLQTGKQVLGKVDIRNERASAVVNGKEEQFEGPKSVHPFLVLCRKARRWEAGGKDGTVEKRERMRGAVEEFRRGQTAKSGKEEEEKKKLSCVQQHMAAEASKRGKNDDKEEDKDD